MSNKPLHWIPWYNSSKENPTIKDLNEMAKNEWDEDIWDRWSKTISKELITKINRSATSQSFKQKHRVPCITTGGLTMQRIRGIVKMLDRSMNDREHPMVISARIMYQFSKKPKLYKQPFSDCNHRTAYYLCGMICESFGIELTSDELEVSSLYQNWDEMGLRKYISWIEDHSKFLHAKE